MGDIMDTEIKTIIQVMYHNGGGDISMYDEAFIGKILRKRWQVTGVNTASEYEQYLAADNREVNIVQRCLNIHYSEFFRSPLTFALLEQWILPKLVKAKSSGGEIRVWSAGCSAGQEAYSIAMLLDQLGTHGEKIRFRIFATDISETVLAVARKGIYDNDAMRNVRCKELKKYFTQEGENYIISPRLRENITFSKYDLLDQKSIHPPESIYGDFDIIFCSNLLFYYKPYIQCYILQQMRQAMSNIGYLITGEAERRLVNNSHSLEMIAIPAPIFQIKKM